MGFELFNHRTSLKGEIALVTGAGREIGFWSCEVSVLAWCTNVVTLKPIKKTGEVAEENINKELSEKKPENQQTG